MRALAVLLSLLALLAGLTAPAGASPGVMVAGRRTTATPLAGRVIVIDPGHQLGNSRHRREIGRLVTAGPTKKACNTTGTATNGGYPEATFTWAVARQLQAQLVALGARVALTRSSNSAKAWGPCVTVRGSLGNRVHADLTLSIHGDGSYARGARGFHVIAPGRVRGWTDDIAARSLTLAKDLRAGLDAAGYRRATYIAGGDGLDVRTDLGTLNCSDVPVAMVESGNMRSAADARWMTSASGRRAYAAALVTGIRHFLR